jgi:hypothetical protein
MAESGRASLRCEPMIQHLRSLTSNKVTACRGGAESSSTLRMWMHSGLISREKGADPEIPRDASWGERYFYVLDPDGHELSFAQPLQAVR